MWTVCEYIASEAVLLRGEARTRRKGPEKEERFGQCPSPKAEEKNQEKPAESNKSRARANPPPSVEAEIGVGVVGVDE